MVSSFVQEAIHTLDRKGREMSCHEDNGDYNLGCRINIMSTILFIL